MKEVSLNEGANGKRLRESIAQLDAGKACPFWRPIETAPKDARDVFLRRGGSVWVGRFYSEEAYEFGELKRKREGWTSPFPTIRIRIDEKSDDRPTHWAEIPPLDE